MLTYLYSNEDTSNSPPPPHITLLPSSKVLQLEKWGEVGIKPSALPPP